MEAIRNFTHDPDALMTEAQVSQLTGFSQRAYQAWRSRGGGPRFVKISARAIRYRRRDVLSWIEERLRSSTSSQGGNV